METLKVKSHKAGAGVWLTIRLMEVFIEPTDVLRIIYAILQVRRRVPLQNESEDEHERRIGERYARITRTIGVRRGLEFRQLTKAEAAVLMTVALEVSFKALVLGKLANNRELIKAGERIIHDIPFGEVPAKRHVVKGREGPWMLAIETEAITIATLLLRGSHKVKAQ